ncbi:MAG: C1 family peptidase [Alloprevotella sp.]|nr:C1 family peptidase [Alloprevotella sp.]MBR1652938.1 C1 family peptidase [Alloprevotella sp.]
MKRFSLTLALAATLTAAAQTGGITPQMMADFKAQHPATAADRAMRNALAKNAINDLALTADNPAATETYFSNEVQSKGISNQKSSGRCWLFTSLNVMRARMIQKYGMGSFQFSQSYCFFYDQLEKSNLFLQAVIDNAADPMEDQQNTWLFQNPLSDGGTFCGAQQIITKYGLVPAEVMPESYSADNTRTMNYLLKLKLRQYGLELRRMAAEKASAKALQARKTEMLGTVYHMLCVCLGTPPESFTWTRRTADGKAVETKTYTPLEFYREYVGKDLVNDYVFLMNDPTRPYYKTYSIKYDRHAYDGADWTYLNLPMEEIEPCAIASIKDSTMMYMSCDVGKFYDAKSGVLSLDNFNYADLFGTDFPMDKAERIRTFASASSHAMTLMAVDLDAEGQPLKWKVENSWGPDSGVKGHLVMTRDWFREYFFRLVVEKKYVGERLLELSRQKPVELPSWDPLFNEN